MNQFTSVYIEPSQLYPQPQPTETIPATTLTGITQHYDQALKREFSTVLLLAAVPGAGTLVVRPAITAVSAKTKGLRPYEVIPIALIAAGVSAALASAIKTPASPELFESLVVGSGAVEAALTAGALKDIINAPSTVAFEEISGEAFVTGAIESMMESKPEPQALKDYQTASADMRLIEAMAYVRAYPDDLPVLRSALPSIQSPVLSIWGTHDPLVPPENADVLNKSLPRTRSLLLSSGHFVWEDCAQEYAAAILEWVRGGYRTV